MAQPQLYDPRTKALVDVHDIRAEAAEVTKANPVSEDVIAKLKKSRGDGFGLLDKLHGIGSALHGAGLGVLAKVVIAIAAVVGKLFDPPAKIAVGTIFGVPILKLGFETFLAIPA